MAECRDEGLLLRSVAYSESSWICHVVTREHGLIHVMARGARRAKSPFRAALSPLYVLQLRWRSGRTGMGQLQEVQRHACLLDERKHLQGLSLLSLAARMIQEGESQSYTMLRAALDLLERRGQEGLCAAVWSCLQEEGLLGDWSHCWSCGVGGVAMYWDVGQLCCASCGGQQVLVSEGLRKGIDGVMRGAHVRLSQHDLASWKYMVLSLLRAHRMRVSADFFG